MKWTMKNGNQIDVDDMDDNHLKNTINMLRRNIGDKAILKLILFAEQSIQENKEQTNHTIHLNGDIAQDFNDTQEALLHSADYGIDFPTWDNGEFYK